MIIDRIIIPPIQDRELCIAPLVAAGLIAGGASVFGSALGLKSSSDANKQSQKNQELAFEQQRQLNQEAYERDISLLKNQYKYQVSALKSAGLSPNALSQVGSVSASSSPGSSLLFYGYLYFGSIHACLI